MEKNGSFIVTFMTGRGKHSVDGIPKLLNYLKKNYTIFKTYEAEDGVDRVSIVIPRARR